MIVDTWSSDLTTIRIAASHLHDWANLLSTCDDNEVQLIGLEIGSIALRLGKIQASAKAYQLPPGTDTETLKLK
jgi:hypothetical protein